jgi:glycosyltransferase involved in cell wall biosynthesis
VRILHATELTDGGVAVYLERILHAQRGRGDVVDTLTGESWSLRRNNPLGWYAARRELTDRIRAFRPDVVHLHSFFAGLVGRSVGSRRRPDYGLVYQPHAWAVDAARRSGTRWAIARVERLASRRTGAILCVSEDERRQGWSIGVRAPAHVVGVPVDLERFAPARFDQRQRAKAALGLPLGRTLVCIGRLSRQKGQDLLAAAWERRPLPDATLVLVGPGRDDEVRANAPRTFGSTLIHVGARDDIPMWLAAADAVVQSSRYEGMSTAIGESLAMGRPVISTAVNGAREAIEDPRYGRPAGVVADSVESALAELERCFADDCDDLESWSAAARQRAESVYALETVVDRIAEVYSEIACVKH